MNHGAFPWGEFHFVTAQLLCRLFVPAKGGPRGSVSAASVGAPSKYGGPRGSVSWTGSMAGSCNTAGMDARSSAGGLLGDEEDSRGQGPGGWNSGRKAGTTPAADDEDGEEKLVPNKWWFQFAKKRFCGTALWRS